MAKKEKIAIQRDKTMEPIDIELDVAMGLLDQANKQITELLASLEVSATPSVEPEASAEGSPPNPPVADVLSKAADLAQPREPETEEKPDRAD